MLWANENIRNIYSYIIMKQRFCKMGILNCAAIFSDNMVLQRRKPIRVWGHAYRGDKIEVELAGIKATAVAVRNSWMVTLPPIDSGINLTMTVRRLKSFNSPEETITFGNVAMGEVWLAGGQSNMEVELMRAKDGKDYIDNAVKRGEQENKDVRFYKAKKYAVNDEFFYLDERENGWRALGENMHEWSAVGFHFAWEIAGSVDCPVGILGCNWGGTSICNWISLENHKKNAAGRVYLDEYNAIMEAKGMEAYLAEVEAEDAWFDDWQPKIAEYFATHPDNPDYREAEKYAGEPGHYPPPMGPFSFLRPGGLFETMIKRVAPYSLAGFLYYQGESDDSKPSHYCDMMKLLIEQWRETWADENLPFIFVQLPMWLQVGQPDHKNWARVRSQQMKAFKFVKNCGMAVITDCGETDNLHPIDKLPVGHRLALQARSFVYNDVTAEQANGPILHYTRPIENGIELYFDYAEDGFDIVSEAPTGYTEPLMPAYTFEIAGSKGEFIAPDTVAFDGNKITLTSEKIKVPMYARYTFCNYCETPLYGKNGLPVAPFNTYED
jgi:sialate O-acetylesterase